MPSSLVTSDCSLLSVDGRKVLDLRSLTATDLVAPYLFTAEIPPGAEVIDATGRFVTPGIIDQHSHIAEDSTNEGGTTVSSMTRIDDVLDPTDINIHRDLAGGLAPGERRRYFLRSFWIAAICAAPMAPRIAVNVVNERTILNA